MLFTLRSIQPNGLIYIKSLNTSITAFLMILETNLFVCQSFCAEAAFPSHDATLLNHSTQHVTYSLQL